MRRIIHFGRHGITADTVDEIPEEYRHIVAMLDAMDMETVPQSANLYAECAFGNKTRYAGYWSGDIAVYNIYKVAVT